MRSLYLLRHAKAVADDPDGDRARPLADRGRRASRAVGQWMADHGVSPQFVLCSTAIRTRETLALLLPALGTSPEIQYEDGLYLAGARLLLTRLRAIPTTTGSVLVVGHNPGLHELAVLLAEPKEDALPLRLAAGFPTAAVATFAVPRSWAKLDRRTARLIGFVTPKDIAAEDG